MPSGWSRSGRARRAGGLAVGVLGACLVAAFGGRNRGSVLLDEQIALPQNKRSYQGGPRQVCVYVCTCACVCLCVRSRCSVCRVCRSSCERPPHPPHARVQCECTPRRWPPSAEGAMPAVRRPHGPRELVPATRAG